MMTARYGLAFMLACAPVAALAASDASSAAPSSSPAAQTLPLPMPTSCAADAAAASYDELLGREIDDPLALRFIEALKNAPDARIFSAADQRSPTGDFSRRLADAAVAACRGPLASTIAGRAFVLLANRPDVDLSDARQTAFLDRLNDAGAALVARDHLSTSDVDAALAPFGTSLAALSDVPTSSACATPNVDARVVRKQQLVYPTRSFAERETGTVFVVVAVAASGAVRFARLYRATVAPTSPLVQESLVTAAAASYAPELVACTAVKGTYLFISNFSQR